MLGATLGLILGCVGQPDCPPPALNGPVPANAPGFLVIDRAFDAGAPLTRADGGVVAVAEFGVGIVKPTEPLVPGEGYVLRHACFFSGVADQPFTVSAPAPLPTKTGTLKVTGKSVHRVGVACTEELDAAVVTFAITPDPALEPFLSVVSWTLEIDGATNWVTLPQGSLDAKGGLARAGLGNFHQLNSVHSACRNPGRGLDPGLAPGFHIARLRAVLTGGEPLEAAEADFTIDCGGGCGCGASTPGGFALLALGWLVVRRRFS